MASVNNKVVMPNSWSGMKKPSRGTKPRHSLIDSALPPSQGLHIMSVCLIEGSRAYVVLVEQRPGRFRCMSGGALFVRFHMKSDQHTS